jgi:hypothetical protein
MLRGLCMKDREAIQLFEKSLKQIDVLKQSYNLSTEHTKWLSDTLYLVEEIFGKKSRIYINLALLTWQNQGSFRLTMHPEREMEIQNHQGYLNDLEIARGLIESGIDLIKRRGMDAVFEGKDTPKEASEILTIVSLIENKLRKLVRDKPTKEKEINDAIENLFIGANLDGQFTREKENIVYSSKRYVPDFVFRKIETIVECKFCDTSVKEKKIISEINDDIVAYKTKYPNLIFVVYSVGTIRDVDEFRDAIQKQGSIIVKVIRH